MGKISKSSRLGFIRKKHYEERKQQFQQAYKLYGMRNELRAELCRRDFFYFLQYFWPVVSNDPPVWNWHIKYLCSELARMARQVANREPKQYDLVINIPPGTTKSTVCSVMLPVWCWVNWYWMCFIVASYSGALALEHAEKSRDIVRSDRFKALFPHLSVKKDKDTKSNFRIVRHSKGEVVRPGGNRYSTSVGGTLTGFHGHILIVDDPVDPNRAVSEKELQSANRWIDQTLSTRKADKEVTPVILIMQRLHQNDPSGHILRSWKGVRLICLPGEIQNYREQLQPPELCRYYVNGLLDPVRMPWKVLEDMQAELGQYGYAGQVGQHPVPPGGGMFKVEHFQIATQLPLPIDIVETVRYWDKAGTEGGGAYTVGVKMCKLNNGKFMVLDVRRGRWSSDERERIIREVAEVDGSGCVVYVEQEPGSGGKESAEGTVRNLAGFHVEIDRPTGNKVYRADPYSVQVNAGNVVLLQGGWNEEFIEEHRFFPHGTYKDQVDAAAGAFNALAKGVGLEQIVMSERGKRVSNWWPDGEEEY